MNKYSGLNDRRRPMKRRKSQQLFAKTARRTRRENTVVRSTMKRGGWSL